MPEYGKRDAKALGEYYIRHIAAMTAEDLHGKADIAAELAHRDALIAELRERLEKAEKGPTINCPQCGWVSSVDHLAKHGGQ